MITKEEFEKAVEYCTGFTASCENCPLSEKDFKCGVYLAEYLKKTSLHLRQQAQARRYQMIPVQYYSLMIAQKRGFVKRQKRLTRLAN